MKKISEEERKVWNELFPDKPDAEEAVLTDEEQMKLIIFGRRSTVVNRFKRRNFTKRVARTMVARNDDKLLIEMANSSRCIPCYLASAIIKYTSDARFEKIVNLAYKSGLNAFAENVEKKLVKPGRELKFAAYVKVFGLTQTTQYALIHDKLDSLLRVFVANGGRLSNDIENGLKYVDSLKEMAKIYNEARREYIAKQANG
jgi:hypothetical protein